MSLKLANEANVVASPAVEGLWRQEDNDRQSQRWRTALLNPDSWAYIPDDTDNNDYPHRIPPHNYLVSHSSVRELGSSTDDDAPNQSRDDLQLNPCLAGVRIVESAIEPYENAVGFHHTVFPKIENSDFGLPPPLNLTTPEEEVIDNNKDWSESLKEFISAIREISLAADNEGSLSTSFTESEPSSGSDNSTEFFAMPLTPVLKDGCLADIFVKTVSPNSSITSVDEVLFNTPAPSKTLNAHASSFVPSFSPPAHTGTFPYPSINDSLKQKASRNAASKPREPESKATLPSLSSFTFPTLLTPNKSTTRLTTVKIKKDEQGFFTDVQVDNPVKSDHTAESLLLPPFLQEPAPRRRARVSKTREIVDRLRSSQLEAPTVLDDGEVKKPTLDFSFDLLPKSFSHSPSPTIQDGPANCVRPRSSVSDDGANRGRQTTSSTPSQEDDDEGWIDASNAHPAAENNAVSKVKRARDLFLAFTRRRTDSTSSEPVKDAAPTSSEQQRKSISGSLDGRQNGEEAPTKSVQGQAGSNHKHRISSSRDGWIEGVATSTSTAGSRGHTGSGQPSKPNPVSTSSNSKPSHRKKSSQQHRQGSISSMSLSPTRPAFTTLSNPPYLNVPLMTPASAHIGLMPATAPAPFFFNPTAPAYHPSMPVAFAGPTGYMPASSPFGMSHTPYMTAPVHGTHAVPMVPQHHRKGSSLSAW